MRHALSIIALALAALGIHTAVEPAVTEPEVVEAVTCQWSSVTRYSATLRCTSGTYRACLQSSYWITYCGPWRTNWSASTAAVPCCDTNHYRISHWVDWY